MKIRVTQEDISRGRAKDSQNCPLALALKRTLKASEVKVATRAITIDDDRYWAVSIYDCRYWLTPQLISFIKRFDLGLPVEPFEFEFCDLKPWKAHEYYEYPEY